MEDKVKVRDYLFSHTELFDQYIQDNLDSLDDVGASIISGWKDFIAQDFYIERWLKKYTIFIDDSDKVYGVLGPVSAPEDSIDQRRLPVRVKATLLPFKDKIVYDGFLRFYNVSFGGGIRSRLKQTYLIAKDNDNIIHTLDSQGTLSSQQAATSTSASKATQDWAPLLNELCQQS